MGWLEEFTPRSHEDANAAVSPIGLVLLDVVLPGHAPILGGFILLDHTQKRALIRSRSSWDEDIDLIDREVLVETRQMIESLFEVGGFETGIAALSEFSNTIRSSDEVPVSLVDPLETTADRLSLRLFGLGPSH